MMWQLHFIFKKFLLGNEGKIMNLGKKCRVNLGKKVYEGGWGKKEEDECGIYGMVGE